MADVKVRIVGEDQASDDLKKVSGSLQGLGTAAANSGGAVGGLKTSLLAAKATLLATAAAATGFVMAAGKMYDLGKQGAALEYARDKFDKLSASIGVTSDKLLTDLKAATRGMMTDAALVGSAGNLMALGLAKSNDEVMRLTTVAGGLNMNMNQLVLTLTNMTTMRFDQLGVSVDGFDEKVKTLEKTGLSAAEAFKEAFLQQAEEQLLKVGYAADSAIAPFTEAEVAAKNLGDTLKVALIPAASEAAAAIAELFQGATERITLWGLMSQAVEEGALDWYEFYQIGAKVQLGMMDVDDAMVAVNAEMAQHATEVIESAKQQATLNDKLADFTAQDAATQAMLTGTNLGLATMAGNAAAAGGALKGLQKDLGDVAGEAEAASESIASVSNRLDWLNGKTVAAYINIITRYYEGMNPYPYESEGTTPQFTGDRWETGIPNAPNEYENDPYAEPYDTTPTWATPPSATTPSPGGGGGGGGGGGRGSSPAAEQIREEIEKFEEAADGMLKAASTFSSLAGYAGRIYTEKTIDPLEEKARTLADDLEELAEKYDEVYAAQFEGAGTYALAELNVLEAERLRLLEEQAGVTGELEEHQQRMLELEKAQQNLGYLQQQFSLLKMISEQGLDAEEILQGTQLGVNANVQDIIDAMTRAMTAMIANAEGELGLDISQQAGNIGASIPGGQHGLDMIVPPGYPNDSYWVRASSGERVTVNPEGKSGANNWTLIINEAGRTQDPIGRFGMLKALAGV